MKRKTKRVIKTGWMILTSLVLAAMGCAYIQNQLNNLSNQEIEAQPTASLTADDTKIASTQTSILTIVTATSPLASTEISQPSDLISIISTVEWTPSGGYTSLHPPVSGDLLATEALHLSASQIQAPTSCLERPDCRHAVTIRLLNQVQTISCQQTEQVLGSEYCAEVNIPAGARFRILGILYDTHPGQWNYIPILQILPASDVPCLEGEFRCAIDNTCYANFDGYCRSCLGLEKERCACQSPEGDLPNGSDCQYWQSGDVLMAGKCRAGVCK
jgi:hypothetical protein